jgi:phage terminase large subunit
MRKKKKILLSRKGKRFISRYRSDPFYFIKEVLRVKTLTDEQKAIVNSVWQNKYTGVKAAHNVGKTFIEACIVLAYVSLFKNSIVLTTAPTARQVRDLLWAEINRLYSDSPYYIPGDMKLTGYTINPKWFATGISTEAGKEEESAVKLQGYHSSRVLVVLDEAVGIHPAVWEAVDGIASSDNSKVLAVGNPSNISCAFKKHLDRTDWNVINISALIHPNVIRKKEIIKGAVSYKWVRDKLEKWCTKSDVSNSLGIRGIKGKNDYSENKFTFEGETYFPNSLFQWKVLGEFPDESSDTLIPRSKIQEAFKRGARHSKLQEQHNETVILSLDVARFGTDYSVFALFRGGHFMTIPFYHLDTAKLTGEAINLIRQYKPSKVGVDCDGIGAGVFDSLNEAKNEGIINTELFEIHSGANPLALGQTEQFLNLRAQMYWMFKNDIDSVSLEKNEELEEGLGSIRYFFNSKGKIQIEAKEDLKKRIGRSPDMEDAIVYCNFLKYIGCASSGSFEAAEENLRFKTITEKIGL